jgi:outer membrane protein assembly factor BamB
MQRVVKSNGHTPILPKTHKTHRFNSFASSTPALDSFNVYSVWGHHGTNSHRPQPLGTLLWERDLGGVKGGHGFAVSPIVFEGVLIVPNDQEKGGGAHYGLDCKTGKTRWQIPRESKRLTYSTPCIFTSPKGKSEINFHQLVVGFTSLEPQTGKQLWELSVFGRPHSERAISSPIVAGDLVLGVCGFTTLDTSTSLRFARHRFPKTEKQKRFGDWKKLCPIFPPPCSLATDFIYGPIAE